MTDNLSQTQDREEDSPYKKRTINRAITAAVAVILVVLIIALIVLFFVVTPYVVSGESMLPTLHDGDHIMVLKVGYTISRGDIILFERPGSQYPPVKRVIAVAGDTVSFGDGGWAVNGRLLSEGYIYTQDYDDDYLSPFTLADPDLAAQLKEGLVIQDGELFVLGDNRNNSYDSHSYGAIQSEWLVGKVVNVY